MEGRLLDSAKKDIMAIKDIISGTTDTLVDISRIFIYWGFGFLALCFIMIPFCLYRNIASSLIRSFPGITVIPLILVAIASLITYFLILKTRGFKGLSKPLLIIWLFIIIYVTAIPALAHLSISPSYYTDNNIDIYFYFSPYCSVDTLLFLFAFGLLCMKLFTNLKFTGVLAVIYTIIGLIYMTLFSWYIGMKNNTLYFIVSTISYCSVMSLTFLLLGGYLEFIRVRRNRSGYKYNS
jgi:Apolipoprotein N-acyltransferase